MFKLREWFRVEEGRGMLAWVWVSAVVVALDQLTKWMAEASLEPYTPYAVMPHLNMMLAYNDGAAFSILSGQRWFFVVLAAVASVFIVYWLRKLKKGSIWAALGLALILGGAIGNVIDRILHGKVIDFIDVYFDIPFVMNNYHFATFNVADIAITVGAAVLVFISLFAADKLE